MKIKPCLRHFILLSFVSVFCLLSSTHAQGTWQIVQQKPAVTLFDMQFLPDAMHGYAAGSQGSLSVIFATADGGQNWNALPFPFTTTATVNGVCFVSPDTGWVVGYNGFIARTNDGGLTWVQQISGTSRKLYRVQFLTPAEGWITGGWNDGSSYLLLHTADGGQTWQNMSFGNDSYSCEDVFFADSYTGWVCGLDNGLYGHIHRTNDGGLTWTRQTIPNQTVQGVKVTALEFVNKNKGWASVSSLYLSPAGPVLYTDDGGNTWSVQTTTGMAYNDCIDVSDSLNVAVVGVNILSNAGERLFTTGDGGITWTSANMPVVSYTYGVQFIGTKVWACLNYSQILQSLNTGLSWAWQNYAPYLKGIAFSDPNTGWTVAGSNVQTDHWCYKSTDGGLTWNTDPLAPGGAEVQFIGHNDGWMLYEGNSAKVFHTQNGGLTWSQALVGTSSWTGGMFFANQDSGWVFGSNGNIRLTSNGGVNWASQNAGSTNYIQDVYFVNTHEGWAGGGYGGGNGFISHTYDGGATWSLQSYPGNEHILGLFFLDNQKGWASAMGGKVYKTLNGGVTWTFAGQVSNSFAQELYFYNANVGWLAANDDNSGGFKGNIYLTTDGGGTWLLEYNCPWNNSTIEAIAFQPDNQLWACGGHATILKYAIPVGTTDFTREAGINVNACPNPFSENIEVRFNLRVDASVDITVMDLDGREIASLFKGRLAAGEHHFDWHGRSASGSCLPDGLYILRLASHEFVVNQKLVLAR